MPWLMHDGASDAVATVLTVIYKPDEGTDYSGGVWVDEIPTPTESRTGFVPVLMVNPTTADVWHEYRHAEMDAYTFKTLLTMVERIAIRALAEEDPAAWDFMDMLNTANAIRLDDPRVVAGVNYVAQQGAIDAERVGQVLGGVAPAEL